MNFFEEEMVKEKYPQIRIKDGVYSLSGNDFWLIDDWLVGCSFINGEARCLENVMGVKIKFVSLYKYLLNKNMGTSSTHSIYYPTLDILKKIPVKIDRWEWVGGCVRVNNYVFNSKKGECKLAQRDKYLARPCLKLGGDAW